MLRLCNNPTRRRRYLGLLHPRRPFSTNPKDSTSHSTPPYLQNSNSHHHPPALHRHPTSLSPLSPSPVFSRTSLLALSLSLTVAASASAAYLLSSSDDHPSAALIYDALRRTADASRESCSRILHRMSLTASAASVLWQSLSSVLSSANHEVRSGFELRVAALLADIAAANPSRRSALVGAGGGAVLDWLLEKVSAPGGGGVENCATEAEAARALAYLLADPNVCEAVLGRPHAIPNLLRFIFSFQPQKSNQHSKHRPMNVSEYFKGKSMLVAAIMDIVTSSCDSRDKVSFQPSLSESAKMKDIAIAIQVIEEGGMHLDENPGEDDNDKGKGMKGIGIKILGEATVLGLSRTSGLMKLDHSDANNGLEPVRPTPKTLALHHKYNDLLAQPKSSSAAVPGLWDDLHCQHVAVPFAAWALANWAMASELNRSHIQELDQDGYAVMTALMAPERTVKWHGSLVARLLLEDRNLPLNDSISDWSATLLSTVSHASKIEDIPLAQLALSAFLVSVERSSVARKVIMDRGLHLMRESAQRTRKHKHVQESLAKALELLCNGDMHFPLEESQKWSGILLSWVFGQNSSDMVQDSATKILSFILEDHGPYSVPISQGWLALLLTEILDTRKSTSVKGETQPKSDKVKTQIDQSNTIFAAQTANQVAGAVVNLAGNQLGTEFNSANTFPLEDLLSLEPFARPFKNLKKDALPKFDAADSAMATLKGIKALTEVCAEDTSCQNKVADFGVLCLLRRFLLQDDYEKLAAIETYDASRAPEARDRASHIPSESESVGPNNSSSVRVPPTAHIRKHAARLLTILSLLPKVQNVILEDETWCEWLEECANGNIPGCNDPKIQSYARATLLNISCRDLIVRSSADGDSIDTSFINKSSICPRYSDMLFLINPELPHWKCTEKRSQYIDQWGSHYVGKSPQDDNEAVDYEVQHVSHISSNDSLSATSDSSNRGLQSGDTLVDVVFVHGLRGGPYKTWRISDDKSSTKSGLVEKIDQEAGKQGTFWPAEWLSSDFSEARLFTLKYKTNLTQWSGASLPLQEVSSMLLEKLVAAGIGNRPVVFVTHSMGGLVVKQMLFQAQAENNNLVNNTIGVVFYSCPHFGSKLADMPWRMGLVLRPAPTIGELRSGSSRLIELNELVRNLHRKQLLEVLSFCETKVTPIVEGYGGWAFRMEIVPIESAYPGFGELVVLDSTDHINSCKPINRTDPSYTEILNFLRKLISEFT